MAPKRKRSPSVEFISWTRVALPPFNKAVDDDCVLCTPQNTQFHVSATILSLASPYFKILIHTKQRAKQPLRFDLEESQTPMEIVLRLTYPIPDPVVLDLDDLTDAYVASTKYQFRHAAEALRKMFVLPRFVEREPLRVYAIALRFGLHEEVEIAANYPCKLSIQDWPACEEFDHIPASRYHDLFLCHKRRGAEAVKLLQAAEYPDCKHCTNSWWIEYKEDAAKLLLEAPASDRTFSLQFVVDHLRGLGGCRKCTDSLRNAKKIEGFLLKLKERIQCTNLKVIQA